MHTDPQLCLGYKPPRDLPGRLCPRSPQGLTPGHQLCRQAGRPAVEGTPDAASSNFSHEGAFRPQRTPWSPALASRWEGGREGGRPAGGPGPKGCPRAHGSPASSIVGRRLGDTQRSKDPQ